MQLNVDISRELIAALRHHCYNMEIKMREAVEQAIRVYLKSNKKKVKKGRRKNER